MPFLARRLGRGTTSALASVACALALIPIAMVPSIAMATFGFLIMNVMIGAFWPSFQVYSMSMVPSRHRPMIYGASVCSGGLAGILLGVGGGLLVTITGFREFFLVSSGLTLIGAVLFWKVILRKVLIGSRNQGTL